ncbi:MAG: muconolactone Delta-isomerase family protein [Cyanobacteria bacterium P01_G01_bin.38]
MLYRLDFRVDDPSGFSPQDLFAIWSAEADASLGEAPSGIVINSWRCIGKRRIVAIVEAPSADYVEQILLSLPTIQVHHRSVQIALTKLTAGDTVRFSLDL